MPTMRRTCSGLTTPLHRCSASPGCAVLTGCCPGPPSACSPAQQRGTHHGKCAENCNPMCWHHRHGYGSTSASSPLASWPDAASDWRGRALISTSVSARPVMLAASRSASSAGSSPAGSVTCSARVDHCHMRSPKMQSNAKHTAHVVKWTALRAVCWTARIGKQSTAYCIP